MRAGVIALFVVTLVNYLVLTFWSLPIIETEAGGLRPFDLRSQGYDLHDAQAFLTVLSDLGRAQYKGLHRWLEIPFPMLAACALAFLVWRYTSDAPEWVRPVMWLIIGVTASFDYLENLHVARMLAAGPDGITAALVDAASTATVNRSMLGTLAGFGILGLMIRHLLRRRRG